MFQILGEFGVMYGRRKKKLLLLLFDTFFFEEYMLVDPWVVLHEHKFFWVVFDVFEFGVKVSGSRLRDEAYDPGGFLRLRGGDERCEGGGGGKKSLSGTVSCAATRCWERVCVWGELPTLAIGGVAAPPPSCETREPRIERLETKSDES